MEELLVMNLIFKKKESKRYMAAPNTVTSSTQKQFWNF